MVILGTWGVIIYSSLYERVIGYPSMDFVFRWHIDRIYIGVVHRRIFFEKNLSNGNFGDVLKSDSGDLGE